MKIIGRQILIVIVIIIIIIIIIITQNKTIGILTYTGVLKLHE